MESTSANAPADTVDYLPEVVVTLDQILGELRRLAAPVYPDSLHQDVLRGTGQTLAVGREAVGVLTDIRDELRTLTSALNEVRPLLGKRSTRAAFGLASALRG